MDKIATDRIVTIIGFSITSLLFVLAPVTLATKLGFAELSKPVAKVIHQKRGIASDSIAPPKAFGGLRCNESSFLKR